MQTIYSYTCRDYPGMEACPGRFVTGSEEELWRHMELHAVMAHQEDPASWTADDRAQLQTFIKTETIDAAITP